MTTIVGIQLSDGVIMGSDSLVTASNGDKYSHPSMVKISQRLHYLIAVSGDLEARDIIQHIWEPPTPTVSDRKDIYHFAITKLIPSLKSCFRDNDYRWQGGDDDQQRFTCLVAVNGTLIEFSNDLSICLKESGHYGIGSGSAYALGALHHGASIEQALDAAVANDCFTCSPYLFRTQRRK